MASKSELEKELVLLRRRLAEYGETENIYNLAVGQKIQTILGPAVITGSYEEDLGDGRTIEKIRLELQAMDKHDGKLTPGDPVRFSTPRENVIKMMRDEEKHQTAVKELRRRYV